MAWTRWLALIAASLALAPAFAIDPGVARGELVVDGRTIPLTHAYAHHYDRIKGARVQRELRIVLADREMPQPLLAGAGMVALENLARTGGVRGVLLTADPARPKAGARGTLLLAEPDLATAFTTFSVRESGLRRLATGNHRVSGEARHESSGVHPAFNFTTTFSAPLFRDELPRKVHGKP